MKVYIVTQVDYDCTDIIGVFYDREKAEELKHEWEEVEEEWDYYKKRNYYVEEHEIL